MLLELLPRVGLHLGISLVVGQLARLRHPTFGTSVRLIELHQVPQLRLLLAQALEFLEVSVNLGVRQPLGDRLVARPNGFKLFEHQAAASFSSWRAAWKAASATSS